MSTTFTKSYKNRFNSVDTEIVNNAEDVLTNAGDISSNAGGVSANAGNISGNAGNISDNTDNISTHLGLSNNPHTVTKTQVGLSDVVNKEQLAKDGTIAMTGDLNMGTKKITSVDTVDGIDISEIKQAKVLTETYVGNSDDGINPATREIDVGVDLASKSNVYVIVKCVTSSPIAPAVHRIEYGQGNLAMEYGAVADSSEMIKGFTSNGFNVGPSNEVNESANIYRYIVFYEE